MLLQESNYKKNHHACYVLVDLLDISVGFIDLTRHFPQRSSLGNEHILVNYYFDTNHIRDLPIKNRNGATITNA